MYIEICSNNHSEFIGKGDSAVHVETRFWVDENDIYWYSYDDICDLVKLNNNTARKWYRYDIPEDQKCTCWDLNNYNNRGEQQRIPVDFVTGESARLVVQQHAEYISERDNNIIKSLNNLEFKLDAKDKYFEDDVLVDIINKTKAALESKDYEEWSIQVNRAYHSESVRDMLDKNGEVLFDKEIENAVDEIRYYLYTESDIKHIILEDENEEIKLKIENPWFPKELK